MIKKITYLFTMLFLIAFSWQGMAQSTINITTSGGNYSSEKWVNITTAADGAGSQIWGQGDGTYGNGAGLINENISIAPGTYYVNCYDKYADGWDGTLISVTAYGTTLNDNGGVSPNDGTDDDASYNWGDTQEQELEASLQIVVPNPPSCTYPINLSVDSMTAPSSAGFSWDAVDGASGYNYEIQPQGTTQGTAGAVASGSGTNTSFNATNLVVGTDYTVYVQTDCGGGDTSTYTSLDFTFQPPPANDECSGAIALTVNADLNCGTVTPGTLLGATASGVDESACYGTENDDVWFSFVANATSQQISLTNVAGSPTDLYHSLWEGSCGGLTLVSGSCSDSNTSNPSGLTAGNTYYVRVNSYSSNTGASSTFDICIGTPPPPPANDMPSGAIALTLDLGTSCGANAITGISNAGTTDSGEAAPSCGSYGTPVDRGDLWYTFVAPSTGSLTLNVTNITVMTSVAGAFYSGTVGALVEEDCTEFGSGWPWDLQGLTAGNTYFLRVWDYNNDQTGTFDLCGYYVTCPAPSGLTNTDITSTFANFDWTENGSATSWNVEVKAGADFTPGNGEFDFNTTSTAHPFGFGFDLQPNTTYYWYVRADCGGGDASDWVGSSFTTLPSCPAPSGLSTTLNSETSAYFDWAENGSATSWKVEYKAGADFTPGTGAQDQMATVAVHPYGFAGLTPNTTYYWYVQADCGGGDTSDWVGPATFYTGYCQPEVTSSSSTYIDTFTTTNGSTNISNPSTGFSTDNYGDYYDTMSVSGAADASFDFSAEIVGGTVGCAIWVDWNQDFVFDVSTENVFQNGSYGNGPFTGTITIPAGTADGDYRMRIMIDWNDAVIDDDACTFDGSRGEVEDYKITVDHNLSLANQTIDGFKMFPNPVTNVLNLNANQAIEAVSIYNMLGQEVLRATPSNTQVQMDMNVLPTGSYIVKVQAGEQIGSYNLIKQ